MGNDINNLVRLIETHVDTSFLRDGVKALHLTKETVASYGCWDKVADTLRDKGYTVKDSNFISASRLGHGEYVGFEISYRPKSIPLDSIIKSIEQKKSKNENSLLLLQPFVNSTPEWPHTLNYLEKRLGYKVDADEVPRGFITGTQRVRVSWTNQ